MRRVYQEQQAGEAQHVDDGDVGGDCVQVLLVAGGGEVRTAELLQVGGREAAQWQEVTPTPRRTFVLHGVTINNTVFMIGGAGDIYSYESNSRNRRPGSLSQSYCTHKT